MYRVHALDLNLLPQALRRDGKRVVAGPFERAVALVDDGRGLTLENCGLALQHVHFKFAHGLFVPVEAGLVLVRNADAMRSAEFTLVHDEHVQQGFYPSRVIVARR